ncbi:MAG: DNA polymerase III subunit gamma/tau [Candidatus Dormibacteria bacterium]
MSGALYRRYRSARFADLIGQPHIVATLLSEVRTGRLAHAYLFTGVRGTGKTSTARILARAVNCGDTVEGEPCNRCPSCLEVLGGGAVDVLEIDAASNRGIDDVRELRERVNYLPASLHRKVYIIDEAHMLTTDAWNAFLKTLEEPPPHVIFILATTEPHKIPDTVRSRAQRFDFRRVAGAEIAAHLADIAAREGIELDAQAAALLARAGRGSVRDALSLLDQALATGERPVSVESVRRALGLADPAVVRDILTALGGGDGAGALRAAATAFEAGVEAQQLLREISRLARAAAFGGIGFTAGADVEAEDAELCAELARAAPTEFWVDALELLGTTELNLRQPVDARLQVELCLLRLIHPSGQEVAPITGPGSVIGQQPTVEGLAAEVAPPRPGTPAAPAESAVESAGEPAAIGAGPADLSGWTVAWPRYLEAMNRRDFMLGGLLNSCRPVRAAPGELVIGALYPFHLEQISVDAKMRLLTEVAGEVAGCPTTVTTVLAAEDEGQTGDADITITTQAALETFRGSRLVGSRPRQQGGSDARRRVGP